MNKKNIVIFLILVLSTILVSCKKETTVNVIQVTTGLNNYIEERIASENQNNEQTTTEFIRTTYFAGENATNTTAENTTSNSKPVISDNNYIDSDEFDVDLTILNPNLVYAEVFNILAYPNEYIGKKIKMSGLFAKHINEDNGKKYFAVIIQDATLCCASGIEFELEDKTISPDELFEEDDIITVYGYFETYYDDGFLYATLKRARLLNE